MTKAYELCWINEAFEDRGLDPLAVVFADTGYLAEALSTRGSRCGDVVGDEDIHLLLRPLGRQSTHPSPLIGDEDIHLQLKPLGIRDTHPSPLVGVWLRGVLGYKGVNLEASSP